MIKKLSLERVLLDKLENKIDENYWKNVANNCVLSKEVIDNFWNDLIIYNGIMNQNIPENIIEKHFESTEYSEQLELLTYQVISEEFIERHLSMFSDDPAYLLAICEYQNLSEEFIVNHFEIFNEYDLKKILDNQIISDELSIEINKYLEENLYSNGVILNDL